MAVTARPAACRIEAATLARYPAWQWTQIGPGGQAGEAAGQVVQGNVQRALDVAA